MYTNASLCVLCKFGGWEGWGGHLKRGEGDQGLSIRVRSKTRFRFTF